MTGDLFPSWMLWALLSACFAALTAVFAKVGVEGVGSDMATLIRTAVIFAMLDARLEMAALADLEAEGATDIAGCGVTALRDAGLGMGAEPVEIAVEDIIDHA